MVRKAKRQRVKSYLPYDIAGVALLFAGPIALVSLAWTSDSGALGRALSDALRGFAGIGSYILPFLLVALGVILLVGSLKIFPTNAGIGAVTLFLALISAQHLRITFPDSTAAEYYDTDILRVGGGILGASIALFLRTIIGNICSYIVLTAVAVISILLMTDVPLAHMARRAAQVLNSAIGVVRSRGDAQQGKAATRTAAIDRRPPPVVAGLDTAVDSGSRETSLRDIPIRTGPPNNGKPTRPSEVGIPNIDQTTDLSEEELGAYKLPPLTLLKESPAPPKRVEAELRGNIQIIERTLEEFKVMANVVEIAHGPTVTRYEIQLAPGIKVNKIVSLADNLAMSLAAIDVRVEAPIPGKAAIGVEVPNKNPALVALRDSFDSPEFWNAQSKLVFALGKDVSGNCRFADLTKMPHLLIGGSTNSGKSVCLNTLIASLLYRATPEEVKFILIDPKRVELSLFDGIPHLAYPVVKDVRQAAGILRAATKEMENRYDKFSRIGTRNIEGYNQKAPPAERMYYLVIVVDELADLMMQAGAEVEASICRLAQLARATGIHLVIATQRPSVDIITGTIKANISSRIAFAVSSQVDSRTILDMNGAERLVGRGDMLFMPIDASKPTRVQGPYMGEDETNSLVTYLKEQRKPQYCLEPTQAAGTGSAEGDGSSDELYEDAVRLIVMKGHASTSMLQRRFKIGYTRAARLVDAMEMQGIVGALDGAKPREVLIGKQEIDRIFGGQSGLQYDGENEENDFEDE